jgi:hypothetical protein
LPSHLTSTTPPPARNFALISAVPASASASESPASFWACASLRMCWLIFIEQNFGRTCGAIPPPIFPPL